MWDHCTLGTSERRSKPNRQLVVQHESDRNNSALMLNNKNKNKTKRKPKPSLRTLIANLLDLEVIAGLTLKNHYR